MRGSDMTGRVAGAIVFAVGIAILVSVFVLAHGFFVENKTTLQNTTGNPESSAVGQLGISAVDMLGRIGLLLVMSMAGSLVAGRGIQFYFGAASGGQLSRKNSE